MQIIIFVRSKKPQTHKFVYIITDLKDRKKENKTI